MNKKILLLLAICSLYTINSIAQVRFIPISARTFSVSAGGGVGLMFSDLKRVAPSPIARLNLDYNVTTFFSIGLEGQVGSLNANTIDLNTGPYDLRVKTNMYAGNLNFKLSWGKIFGSSPASLINGFYIGSGLGFLSSSATYNVDFATMDSVLGPANPEYEFERTSVVIPVNIGWDIDLSTIANVHNLGVNLNYQHNILTHDYLDGYKTNLSANAFPDSYGLLSVAVKYYFGRIRATY